MSEKVARVLSDRALHAIVLRRNYELARRVLASARRGQAGEDLLDEVLDELDSELAQHGLVNGEEPNHYGLLIEDLKANLSAMAL